MSKKKPDLTPGDRVKVSSIEVGFPTHRKIGDRAIILNVWKDDAEGAVDVQWEDGRVDHGLYGRQFKITAQAVIEAMADYHDYYQAITGE